MKNLLSAAVGALTVLLTCNGADAAGSNFKGNNWNVTMYDNCGMPSTSGENRSVRWDRKSVKDALTFTLNRGDIGKCSSDRKARSRAPYWERAEVKQRDYLKSGTNYRIGFDVDFKRGFQSERETFFQIHSYHGSCPASPILMMKFDRGNLRVDVLGEVSQSRKNGRHRNAFKGRLNVSSLAGSNRFSVTMNQKQQRLSISLNGRTLVENVAYEKSACARPHIKFGIYRPGNSQAKQSVATFRNVRLDRLPN